MIRPYKIDIININLYIGLYIKLTETPSLAMILLGHILHDDFRYYSILHLVLYRKNDW